MAFTIQGCVSLGASPTIEQRICERAPEVSGSWKMSRRDTQLGPSSWRLDIGCDCTYRAKLRVFGRTFGIRESGEVIEADGRLTLGRANGERTTYGYQLRQGPSTRELVLTDEEGRTTVFGQRQVAACESEGAETSSESTH